MSVTDRHAEALHLHGSGHSLQALGVLADEARDRLGDVELLNDMGVIALDAGRPQVAEAALRTAQLVDPDDAVQRNIEALDRMREDGFVRGLLEELIGWAGGPDRPGNFDPLHNPAGPPGPPQPVSDALPWIMRSAPELEWFHRVLADQASRSLMVRLFAFRLLGARKVELPIGPERTRALIEQARSLRVLEASVPLHFLDWNADRYDLTPLGRSIVADLHPLNVVYTFLLEQYACPEHPIARVRSGDVVVDGGACWGDTALYLASLAGEAGRVISYEFSPSNLELLASNIARNEGSGAPIEVEHRALWHGSDEVLAIEGNGPATQVKTGQGSGGSGVLTRAIDDLPEALGVDRIDFIKLDIEGAELEALKGAERTLMRDRPRLAIALYHKPLDWVEIPGYLNSLGVGYRFSIGHFTIHHSETVLFAWCE